MWQTWSNIGVWLDRHIHLTVQTSFGARVCFTGMWPVWCLDPEVFVWLWTCVLLCFCLMCVGAHLTFLLPRVQDAGLWGFLLCSMAGVLGSEIPIPLSRLFSPFGYGRGWHPPPPAVFLVLLAFAVPNQVQSVDGSPSGLSSSLSVQLPSFTIPEFPTIYLSRMWNYSRNVAHARAVRGSPPSSPRPSPEGSAA